MSMMNVLKKFLEAQLKSSRRRLEDFDENAEKLKRDLSDHIRFLETALKELEEIEEKLKK